MNAPRRGLCGLQKSVLLLALFCGLRPPLALGQDARHYLQALQAPVPVAQRRMAASIRAAQHLAGQYGMAAARAHFQPVVRLHGAGMMEVYLHIAELTTEALATLRQFGVHLLRSDTQVGMVYARVPLAALESVAALPFVRWVGPPSYSMRRAGSVTSEGDAAMRADIARAMAGLTGAGVRVGVISDSLGDLGTSVHSGDLPAQVTVIQDQNAADEGRAMAEIIHDLAPGAALLFHAGAPTSLDFIAAVRALVQAGAHVIVDDLGFFAEPVFEEGDVAQAVRQAIQQGVVYVSAAGNDAQRHYQGMYHEFDPHDGNPQVNLHDFGGGETRLNVRLESHTQVAIFVQWPNRFDGSANTADYDILLVDAAGNTLAISNDVQRGTQAPPLEVLSFGNHTDRPVTAGVVINRVAGPALPLALYFVGDVRVLKHQVPTSSVVGHPCVRDVLAVGAIDANDPGFDTLEDFSSRGPCELFFPTHELRTKPDVVGADGVMTSFPGLTPFTPFFGTSAAAPHVAAVAALVMEAAGGPGRVSNTQVANTLRVAALPRGPAGVNNSFGHGVVDAVLAVQAIRSRGDLPPRSVIDAPGTDMTIAPHTALDFQGNCVDAEGDTPFALAWDFGTVAAGATGQNPGAITFPSVGVFRVTLTCTDATGRVDPNPAVRLVTVDTPPDSQITSPTSEVTVPAGGSLTFAGTCRDPDDQTGFTFLWTFGGGAEPSSSVQPNPDVVTFHTPGIYTVSLACTDVLGVTDPSPATVRVMVTAVRTVQNNRNGVGGGGGGCALLSGGVLTAGTVGETLGNIGLPVLLVSLLRLRRRTGVRLR